MDSIEDIGVGASATMDGLIPFFDPFAKNYSPCDEAAQWSKVMGQTALAALLEASGAGIIKGKTGYEMTFNYYKNAKGVGMNILKRGERKFAVDWHRFKSMQTGGIVNKIHKHIGATKSQMKKHRGIFTGNVL